jgi:hypothetical protein
MFSTATKHQPYFRMAYPIAALSRRRYLYVTIRENRILEPVYELPEFPFRLLGHSHIAVEHLGHIL